MGLIKNPGEDKYAVLSDILGDEDHLGDMDFKTTGTRWSDSHTDGYQVRRSELRFSKALMQAKGWS